MDGLLGRIAAGGFMQLSCLGQGSVPERPDEAVAKRDLAAKRRAAIDDFKAEERKPEQRRIVELVYEQGLSIQAAAEAMEMPHHQVYQAEKLVRNRLAAWLRARGLAPR